jgi:rod shape-determining protein MreC
VEENAKLKEILFNNIDISEAEMDSIILTNNLINQIDYIIMPARVVYNSINLSKNYLTINKGKLDGVETGMGVISSRGIVGKVIKTIDHHSLVMSVLNTENSISAKIKSNQELGYIKWDGSLSEIIDLNDISKFKRVELGDSIVTSDYNTVYPSDILIGVVAEIGLKEDGNFHEIKVLLSNEFQKLKNVYLVKNKNKKEIDSIIEEINSLKEDE